MRKILLVLLFVSSYWQINAQLKISTTATKLCEGTEIPLQITGIPANSNVQFQRDGVDFLPLNVASVILKPAPVGSFLAKAFSKDVKWNRKSPDVDYRGLNDIFFVNAKVGYAVGRASTIIKTIDGGNTWKEQASPGSGSLQSIYFIDELNGWAVGDYGTVIRTTDGGNNWKDIRRDIGVNNTDDFSNVQFIDSKVGFIVNIIDKVYKTIDGGKTWTSATSGNYDLIFKTFFVDANTGFATDFAGVIKKTLDAGKTWKIVYDIDKDDPQKNNLYRLFTSIYFIDKNIGWAVGYNGAMVATSDGGKTWISRKGVNDGLYFHSIIFTDVSNGLAMTFGTDFLQTADGGKTWVLKSLGLNINTEKATFLDGKNGWAVGVDGIIIKTANGGTTWEKLRGNSETYTDIAFVNAQTGFRVGGNGLIEKTADGGDTWKPQKSTTPNYLQQVQFSDVNTGWVLPYAGASILTTTDGGTTWKSQKISVNKRALNYFKFIDSKNGFAVGNSTTIAKTSDGGNTWSQVKTTLDTNVDLTSVSFSDSKNGWITGTGGTIIKTIDGGISWNRVKLDSKYAYNYFVSSYFFDTKNGLVIGLGESLLKTIDGGITWSEISAQIYSPKSMTFIDSKNGWITTYDGLYKTIDGGNNWEKSDVGNANAINGSFFLNAQTGWAVGNGNTYIKYEAPLLSTSNTITINPKPAIPTLAWSNSDGKLTATTTTTSPQLTWLKGVDELKNITATTYQPTSSGSYSVRVTDGNGCSEISKAVEITILASENPLNDSGVNVYPNPSNNGIFKVAYTRFSNEMEATLQIIGLDGLPLNSQKMVRQNNTFEGEINASNLATGIYLLQIISGEQKAVVKISITK